MKMLEFRFKFYWSLFQYSSIGSDNGLAAGQRQAIIWTNDGYITDAYMRHLASMSECAIISQNHFDSVD